MEPEGSLPCSQEPATGLLEDSEEVGLELNTEKSVWSYH
jgi:hypothetical protein